MHTSPTSETGDTAVLASAQTADDLLSALTAAHRLHAKQLTLLDFLNRHRDPASPIFTVPLSYARIQQGTLVTIDHIRRGGLHGLLLSGLISVKAQTYVGTVYRFHQEASTIAHVVERLGRPVISTDPLSLRVSGDCTQSWQDELTSIEERLTVVRQIQEQRQQLKRQEFLTSLSQAQLDWLIAETKKVVDQQEGIRFVRDRYAHYEAYRLKLIDEWIARTAYGQTMPSLHTNT